MFRFETFNEPVLMDMLQAAQKFVDELAGACSDDSAYVGRGRWLTLLGNSGTGKTFLAKQIHAAWKYDIGVFVPDHGVAQTRDSAFYSWPKTLEQFRDGDFYRQRRAEELDLVVLDEIGADHDRTGFGRDQLFKFLNRRVGKWTVITGNMTLGSISSHLDERIASRIIRDENRWVEVDTEDYYAR